MCGLFLCPNITQPTNSLAFGGFSICINMTRRKLKTLAPRVAVLKTSKVAVSSGNWRGTKTSNARGYGYKWQQARQRYLADPANALCVYCNRNGRVVVATVVDHIIPHKGDDALFWNRNNWQPLCTSCHSSTKQKEENK